MLDGLKALVILEKLGTVSETAVHLRLTQSAVSKRLQALEIEMGYLILEKDGRRLRITSAGLTLLGRAKHLINELENLKWLGKNSEIREFSIGVADSIASSWGPKALQEVLQYLPQLHLEIHVHRSTLIIENIKLGRYDLGLVTAQNVINDLSLYPVYQEEMVLIGTKGKNILNSILTIEQASATWKELSASLLQHKELQGQTFQFVESFAAAAQMAKAGFGKALVPMGIAKVMGFTPQQIVGLSPKVKRQIQLIGRKSVFENKLVQQFSSNLNRILQK